MCRAKVVGCPSQEGGFDDSVIVDEVDSVCVGYVKAGSRSYHVEARRPAKGAAVAASRCCKPSIILLERTRAHTRTHRRNATTNIGRHAMGCGVNSGWNERIGYTRSTAMCNAPPYERQREYTEALSATCDASRRGMSTCPAIHDLIAHANEHVT